MASRQQESAFLSAFSKTASKKWDTAKKAKASGFGTLKVPDGRYEAVFNKFSGGVDRNKNPYFRFSFAITAPDEFAKKTGSVSHFLTETKNQTVDQKLERLVGDLKALGATEAELDDPNDIGKVLARLEKEQPLAKISVKNTDSGGDPFVNILGLVDDEDVNTDAAGDGDDGGDGDDDGATSAGDDDGDGDGDNADEDQPVFEPVVGDWFLWKKKGARKEVPAKVVKVNLEKATVSLQIKGERGAYKDISFDALGEYCNEDGEPLSA